MEDTQVNSRRVEHEYISLICYLITSARGLVDEPKIYGPSRLLYAAQRLVRLAAVCGIDHRVLVEIAERIEEDRLEALLDGEDAFTAFMDELTEMLADWLKDAEGVLCLTGTQGEANDDCSESKQID